MLRMGFIEFILVICGITTVTCDTHSLTYIYTALSKPVNLPGIHDFTAMGILDGRMIDYYDSHQQKKVPKQMWIEERMDADYWEKGTTSRKSKEQWFKVNLGIVMDRMRHNNTDLHVLQWRHGCEVIDKNQIKGIDSYSYDGKDFLSFDEATSTWSASVSEAVVTKRKWDEVQILNQYTKGYLEKECVDWLDKFVSYGDQQARDRKPEVSVFAAQTKNPQNLRLTCFATGFYPKDVVLEIRRNFKVLNEYDGVESTGVRPNHDFTHQIKKSVEIRKDDKAHYDCLVQHRTLHKDIEKTWDNTCPVCEAGGISVGVIAATVAVVLFLVATVLGILHHLKIIDLKSDCTRGKQREPELGIVTVANLEKRNGEVGNGNVGQALLNGNAVGQDNDSGVSHGSTDGIVPPAGKEEGSREVIGLLQAEG